MPAACGQICVSPGAPTSNRLYGMSPAAFCLHTQVFDPAANKLVVVGTMQKNRWYPSPLTLINGKVRNSALPCVPFVLALTCIEH